MGDTFHLPLVDFSAWRLDVAEPDVTETELLHLAGKLHEAFCSIGFVYITNHGIHKQQVLGVSDVTQAFFRLPVEEKCRFARVGNQINHGHGYAEMELEALNPERPGDLKEMYNITYKETQANWPNDLIPAFDTTTMAFFDSCYRLSQRVLQLIAIGLGLKDRTFFSRKHNPYTKANYSTLRFLLYPPLPATVKPGQVRCGEHTDYGSITLLFQEGEGGLEVCDREGVWREAPPIPGAVLINVADLMMRWTGDQLISTNHRVMIPEDEARQQQSRYSIAYFAHPDDEETISCVGDNPSKYPPILSGPYTRRLMDAAY